VRDACSPPLTRMKLEIPLLSDVLQFACKLFSVSLCRPIADSEGSLGCNDDSLGASGVVRVPDGVSAPRDGDEPE
jgi:hypothetical protein